MIDERLLREAERQFGVPYDLDLSFDVDVGEYDMVIGSMKDSRSDDVTFFIMEGDNLVVIRKPMFPPGVYRAPSGGVRSGEALEQAAVREAYEETGLRIQLEKYVLRVAARFRLQGREPIRWGTHVFLATPIGDLALDPKDTREIAEAKWVPVTTLQGPIRDTLLATGQGLFRYRVALTDATLERLALFEANSGNPRPLRAEQGAV